MMDNLEKVNYWDSLSVYDIETAKVMLTGKRYLYVGFMCHQAVEKSLKAYHWFVLSTEPEYIHSLLRLSRKCAIYEKMSKEFQLLLDTLEPLNIEARYPTQREKLIKSLTRERCLDILQNTEGLLLWLKKQYSK